jgi:riboflavin biosynthesis pyrimidine reductase
VPDWRARFEAFAARKLDDARRASLPPYRTDDDAPSTVLRAVGNDWTRSLFDGNFYISPPHRQRPSCSLVFVQSADCNTGASDPSSLGGGLTDKHLVYEGLSRVAADAVLAGAETIRGGHTILSVWHPELVRLRASLGLPRHPIQVVATLRGLPIDDMLLFNLPEVPAMLVTVGPIADVMHRAIAARPWVTPILMERKDALPAAFAGLYAHGIGTLSCIGGRTLARQLLDAKLVDDVYLTTAARPGGEPRTPLHDRPWRGETIVRKHGTGVETGVLFEHLTPLR